MSNPWWSDNGGFFGRKYRECDDSLEGYIRGKQESLEERTKREVDGIIKLLNLSEGSEVLDCPCGYGRHSIELGLRKIRAYGVDINKEHLKQARKVAGKRFFEFAIKTGMKADEQREFEGRYFPVFHEMDMRKINSEECLGIIRPFGALINMFYSFGFFGSDEENKVVMKEFYDCLKPNGQLLLHTDVSPEIISSGDYGFAEIRNLKSGKRVEIKETYNPQTKRMNGYWTIIGKDKKEEKLTPYSVRIYSAKEFEKMTKEVGFREVKFYGSFEGNEFSNDSKELIMVARK